MYLLIRQCKYLRGPCSFPLSTKVAVKDTPPTAEQTALKDYEKLSKVYTKVSKKKPQKPPFVKNLFIGAYDTDMLTYPETLDKTELKWLDESIAPLKQAYMGDREHFGKDFQLYGLQAPQLAGGRELNVTETCRFNEFIAERHGEAGLIHSEQLGVQLLLKVGTQAQLDKYLDDVVSGRTVVAFCLNEVDLMQSTGVKTSASYDANKNSWSINGEKSWIVNGNTADLMIVFAQTKTMGKMKNEVEHLSAFLVERTFGGVTSKPVKTIGLDQTDISSVRFDNTLVPAENIIGTVHKGDELLSKVLTEHRLSAGPISSALTRTLINKFVDYCKKTSSSEGLAESDMVNMKVSEMTSALYAMESMTYLTSSLIDGFENQDCEMEAAIVKAFSVEQCHQSTLNCMTFLGTSGLTHDHWCNELHRNALCQLSLTEPLDTLKIIIALQGLQYAGIHMQDEIKKLRNPLFHAGHVFRKMWSERRHARDNPRLNLFLHHYLHPSTIVTAGMLEYCVLRFQFAVELLFRRYGVDAITKHMDLIRLANSIIDIYAMTACLGRASRSYCIGLRHGDYEVMLANTFCIAATARVKRNINEIFVGPYGTTDGNQSRLGAYTLKIGQYFPEHALTKNF